MAPPSRPSLDETDAKREKPTPDDLLQLQQLRTQLQNNIQQARAAHHAFEPVSLPGSQPVSRVSTIMGDGRCRLYWST